MGLWFKKSKTVNEEEPVYEMKPTTQSRVIYEGKRVRVVNTTGKETIETAWGYSPHLIGVNRYTFEVPDRDAVGKKIWVKRDPDAELLLRLAQDLRDELE